MAAVFSHCMSLQPASRDKQSLTVCKIVKILHLYNPEDLFMATNNIRRKWYNENERFVSDRYTNGTTDKIPSRFKYNKYTLSCSYISHLFRLQHFCSQMRKQISLGIQLWLWTYPLVNDIFLIITWGWLILCDETSLYLSPLSTAAVAQFKLFISALP